MEPIIKKNSSPAGFKKVYLVAITHSTGQLSRPRNVEVLSQEQ